MNTLEIEERVRAATRAAGDTVAPDSVPPLRLRSERPFRFRASAWARWLAPVAAAAAVIAVAVAMVTVGHTVNHRTGGTAASSVAPNPVKTGPPLSSYIASGRVPKYYLSVESIGKPSFNPSYAVVRETATGRSPGAWTPADGQTVVAVTAAADDQTFVADVQPFANLKSDGSQSTEPRTFYTLVLSRTTGIVKRVNRLPMSVRAGQLMTGFALSPDGKKLAIALEPANETPGPNLTKVKVITLATGAVRTWTADGLIGFDPDDAKSLSWTDNDRTLAFNWEGSDQMQTGVWLLDLAKGGSSLLADSREALTVISQALGTSTPVPSPSVPVVRPASSSASPVATRPMCQEDSVITSDASTIVCGAIKAVNQVIKPPSQGGLQRGAETEYLEWSAASGKVTRVLGHWTFGSVGALSAGVLWSNASGSVLIGWIPNSRGGLVGVISGNEFTPLPGTFLNDAW
ncbi:MAG TPA: hypothetical protein VKG61_16245 [Streptosporangiaceae bacterium]|nr:hypothetical protein [Streptosporangiaceae bacterium]